MGYIPHPEIPLGNFRPADLLLLLVAGALWEVIMRVVLFSKKRKPTWIKNRELKLKALEKLVVKKRALGPSAFVETSKLERQQLVEVKALAKNGEQRQLAVEKSQKQAKTFGMVLAAVIFVVYYGIPLMEFSAHRVMPPASSGEILTQEQAAEIATKTMQGFLFPLSYVGMGIRISKLGLPNPKSSVGALLVFWSAQTTVGKLMDGVEALLLEQ